MTQPEIRVEEILKQVGLLEEITKQHGLLTGMVRVARSQGNMDKDTLIYRLAMMFYHAKRLTKQPLISALEDPGAIYLHALDNPRLQAIIMEMSERYRAVPVVELVKTFMCFLMAAYIVEITS